MTFSEVSEEQYQALLLTAQAQGLDLQGISGSTAYQGLEFTWLYDAPARTLTIQCTHKPIFIPCSMIEQRIRALIS
jgi:hypothetical protein